MSRFHEEALSVSNCKVREGKYCSELGGVVGSALELSVTQEFVVPSKMFDNGTGKMTLGELPGILNFQRVSVRVKVIAEEGPLTVNKRLLKQENVVADTSESCKVVTWEKDVGAMEIRNSYELTGLMTRVSKGETSLHFERQIPDNKNW